MAKRHGLTNNGHKWYESVDAKYFTYEYDRMWLVYERELDADGTPIDGGADEYCGAWPTLKQAANDIHEMNT